MFLLKPVRTRCVDAPNEMKSDDDKRRDLPVLALEANELCRVARLLFVSLSLGRAVSVGHITSNRSLHPSSGMASIDQNGGPVLSWVTAVSLTGFHRTCGSSSNTGSKLPAVDKDSRGHGVRLARLLPEVAFPSMINSSSRSRWIPTKLLARARKIDRDLQDWLQILLPFEPV